MGTGPGSIPYNLQKTDINEIYYFETDPDLWKIINPYRKSIYHIGEESPKLRVIKQDLRLFLRESGEKFDIIICFPPQPENIMLNRFYTREFYSLCRMHLKTNGIFISSVHGFSNYMSEDLKRFIASIYKGFTSEFPHILKTSGETVYLIGAVDRDVLPESFDHLIERYRKRHAGLPQLDLEREITQNFSPEEMRVLSEKTQLDYFNQTINPLLSEVDENLDLKPLGYWNQIVLSAFQEQSVLYSLLKGFFFFPLLSVLLSGVVLIDIRRRYGRGQFINGMIMYTVGFISISTMILMIILYQNFTGIVYYRISLINALFMLGLTVGSYTFNRTRKRPLAAIFLLLALTLAGLFLYIVMKMELLFWLLILAFSFLCGAVFPILFSSAEGEQYHTTASVLDAMDHLGSIIGSLITVLLLLPLVGIHGTIILTVALSLAIAFSSYPLSRGS
jgi:spermidine synthase